LSFFLKCYNMFCYAITLNKLHCFFEQNAPGNKKCPWRGQNFCLRAVDYNFRTGLGSILIKFQIFAIRIWPILKYQREKCIGVGDGIRFEQKGYFK
jgi:hypothetical protein